ncbi:Endoglucanase 3 [Hordeum vulgare]|nr:Endoglucanase 3 [Hordeum vulgare]
MCVQRPDEPLRDYVTRWTELRNSCEGVHEVQAIEYFIGGCRDGTFLKHKLMCFEPTSLVVLMAKANKYATDDSAMRVKVTALDKAIPTSSTPKPVGDNRGGQNNNKRKADQLDSRSNNKLVANMEEEAPALNGGSPARTTGSPSSPSSKCLTTRVAGYASCAGYSSCAGYTGSADSNCCTGYNYFVVYEYFTGYNNQSGFAKPRILSSPHLVGGSHGGRRRAGFHDGIGDRESRAYGCFIKHGGCRSP